MHQSNKIESCVWISLLHLIWYCLYSANASEQVLITRSWINYSRTLFRWVQLRQPVPAFQSRWFMIVCYVSCKKQSTFTKFAIKIIDRWDEMQRYNSKTKTTTITTKKAEIKYTIIAWHAFAIKFSFVCKLNRF